MSDPVVIVPVDLDLEDRLAGPVTFRMAGWLAAAGAGLALLAFGGGTIAAISAGALLVAVGLLGALWQPGGRPLMSWLAPLTAYRHRHRQRQTAEVIGCAAADTAADPATSRAAEAVGDGDLIEEADIAVGWSPRPRAWAAGLAFVVLLVGSGVGGWALARHERSTPVTAPNDSAPGGTAPASPARERPEPADDSDQRLLPGVPVPTSWPELLWWVDCDC